MQIYLSLIFRLGGIIAVSIAVLALVYVWVIPNFFPGYKTYFFLAFVMSMVVLVSGYYSYEFADILSNKQYIKILYTTLGSLITSSVVLFFSFFIILNIKGS